VSGWPTAKFPRVGCTNRPIRSAPKPAAVPRGTGRLVAGDGRAQRQRGESLAVPRETHGQNPLPPCARADYWLFHVERLSLNRTEAAFAWQAVPDVSLHGHGAIQVGRFGAELDVAGSKAQVADVAIWGRRQLGRSSRRPADLMRVPRGTHASSLVTKPAADQDARLDRNPAARKYVPVAGGPPRDGADRAAVT
jgi:hypothetical protein